MPLGFKSTPSRDILGHLPHLVLFPNWAGRSTPGPAHGIQPLTGMPQTTAEPRAPEISVGGNREPEGGGRGHGGACAPREKGAAGPRRNERSGRGIAVDWADRWEPSAGRARGRRRSANQSAPKAVTRRERPREGRGASRSPPASAPPALSRRPGPDSAAARGGRSPQLSTRQPFRAALTSATAASRAAPRSVTGTCRRVWATAARGGSRPVGGRHRGSLD